MANDRHRSSIQLSAFSHLSIVPLLRTSFRMPTIRVCIRLPALLILCAVLSSVGASSALDKGCVCGHDDVTYPSKYACKAAGTTVMHCAACGQCSNDHDIGIYHKTSETLTSTTTKCAVATLLFGRAAGTLCMNTFVSSRRVCVGIWPRWDTNRACFLHEGWLHSAM